MSTQRTPAPIDDARRRVFLDHVREHGIFAWAAAAASPTCQTRRGAAASFRSLMRRDQAFAEEVEAAREEADGKLEAEAWRRAVQGVRTPVFQKGRQAVDAEGNPAFVTVASDRLLEIMLRARVERFQDRSKLEISGQIDHRHLGLVITPGDLVVLSAEQRSHLRGILSVVAHRRGEVLDDRALAEPHDDDDDRDDAPAALPAPTEAQLPELAHLTEEDRAELARMCS